SWSVAYAVAVFLIAGSAFSGIAGHKPERAGNAPPIADRLIWLALAACPSILFLGSANALSQNVAPIPFLWILPLGVYLLTLILCFEREGWYRPRVLRLLLPLAWLVIGYVGTQRVEGLGLKTSILAMSIGLFVCCMFCHGELAKRKPPVDQLTA